MADVIMWRGITRLDLPAQRVIQGAAEGDLEDVVVLGWNKQGDFYFAATYAAGPEVLWLLELAKLRLLRPSVENNDG